MRILHGLAAKRWTGNYNRNGLRTTDRVGSLYSPMHVAWSNEKESKEISNMSRQTREYAKKLVAQMTIEEKMSQMLYESPAIERLHIPAYN